MEQVVAMFRYILEWASSKDGEKWPVEKAKKKGDHVLNAMSREVTPERNPVIERLLWRGRRGCSSETRLFQLREFLVHAARTVWIIQPFLVFFVFLFYSILSSFLSFFFFDLECELNFLPFLFFFWIRFLRVKFQHLEIIARKWIDDWYDAMLFVKSIDTFLGYNVKDTIYINNLGDSRVK